MVTDFDLGVEVFENGARESFVQLIPKGAAIPSSEKFAARFHPSQHGQNCIRLAVCAKFAQSDATVSLGVLEWSVDHEMTLEDSIEVEFILDNPQTLAVHVRLDSTSSQFDGVLQLPSIDRRQPENRQEGELETAVESAKAFLRRFESFLSTQEQSALEERIRRAESIRQGGAHSKGPSIANNLRDTVLNSGVASLLFLAQACAPYADKTVARQLMEAKWALERAFHKGDQQLVAQLSQRLQLAINQVKTTSCEARNTHEPYPGQLRSAEESTGHREDQPTQVGSSTLWKLVSQTPQVHARSKVQDVDTPIIDRVNFSAFAPPIVRAGRSFILSIWAYLDGQREQMLNRAKQISDQAELGTKGPVRVTRGGPLAVHVEIPGFRIDDCVDTIDWEGQPGNAAFAVTVPDQVTAGTHVGKARIICAGVQIANLLFSIDVQSDESKAQPLDVDVKPIRSIFASYASDDRTSVLQWARGARAVGVDVFVDVLSLREGQDWETALWEEIPSRDMFSLFWSGAASKSPWVQREWRCALAARGIEFIYPIPLADVRDVAPPPELAASKHFNDLARIVIEYERTRSDKPGSTSTTNR